MADLVWEWAFRIVIALPFLAVATLVIALLTSGIEMARAGTYLGRVCAAVTIGLAGAAALAVIGLVGFGVLVSASGR